ncbi:metallophosphoesterase family protein [Acidovorax sp.]|uniref:metallophosphoesterase family protein n=1 Tax=Acidovorax sp. TaxID=1872122 RepID=UPI003D03D992
MFTILHISDLHRSPTDPIENSTLLGSLLSDMDRYRTESSPIPAPDAAIVSGDVIQGVTLNFPGYADELTRQYEAAHNFLVSLADRVFGGDRSKVVIVPGNHDVCWNTAKSAMQARIEETPSRVSARSFSSDTSLRWDWETRQIFEISNKDRRIQKRSATPWISMNKGGVLRVVDQQLAVHSQR